MPTYYPAYLNLQGRRCVVIGAGEIAERKIAQLLEASADVSVISPEATTAVQQWAANGQLHWSQRAYQQGDLADAWVAIAATDDPATNQQISSEAEQRRIFLNIVDKPALCGFIAPAIVRRGPVTVAISTGGLSPALARKLRETLQESAALSWADAGHLLADVRRELKRSGIAASPDAWQAALDGTVLALVQAGRMGEARDRLLTTLKEHMKVHSG